MTQMERATCLREAVLETTPHAVQLVFTFHEAVPETNPHAFQLVLRRRVRIQVERRGDWNEREDAE